MFRSVWYRIHSVYTGPVLNWNGTVPHRITFIKPGFHEANFDHDNDQFWIKTKRLVGRMTAQPHNRFVFCVVVVTFAVSGN